MCGRKSFGRLSPSGALSRAIVGLLLLCAPACPLSAFPWSAGAKATGPTPTVIEESAEAIAPTPTETASESSEAPQETPLTQPIESLQSLKASRRMQEKIDEISVSLTAAEEAYRGLEAEYGYKADEADALRKELSKLHFGLGLAADAKPFSGDGFDFGLSVLGTVRKDSFIFLLGVGYDGMMDLGKGWDNGLVKGSFGVVCEF